MKLVEKTDETPNNMIVAVGKASLHFSDKEYTAWDKVTKDSTGKDFTQIFSSVVVNKWGRFGRENQDDQYYSDNGSLWQPGELPDNALLFPTTNGSGSFLGTG